MKACLFILLLAAVFCSTDLVAKIKQLPDIVTCLLKSEVVRTVVLEVYQAIVNKEWSKVLTILVTKGRALYAAVKACLPA